MDQAGADADTPLHQLPSLFFCLPANLFFGVLFLLPFLCCSSDPPLLIASLLMYKFICYVLNTELQYVTNTTLRCNYVGLLGCFTSIYPGLALGALVIDVSSCWEFRLNPCTQVADVRWRRKPDHGELYHLVDW